MRRALAWLERGFFTAIVTVTDWLPPRIRYGYVHRLTRAVLAAPTLSVRAAGPAQLSAVPPPPPAGPFDLECMLAVADLESGGIGSVIEPLASGLAARGIRPVVVAGGEGTRARRLRERGIDVLRVDTAADAESVLRARRPDVVQLHSASRAMEVAAIGSGVPIIPVFHNTEIHFTPSRWREVAELVGAATVAVAVSETVRDFHARRLPGHLGDRIVVIPNGSSAPDPTRRRTRGAARAALGSALGTDLDQDVVFLTLARYDAQKNISGTVASFLAAVAEAAAPIRLVVAGEVADWAEYRRADAIRRSSRHAGRIHLLGLSDAATLLAAADAFVLDSFFEGWPMAATEALASGLPLALSDVGGARELIEQAGGASVLMANASGPAASVTDARVAAARRHTGRQSNQAEFAAAVRSIAAAVQRRAPQPGALEDRGVGLEAMCDDHAWGIRESAASLSRRDAR